jgi:xanthine dehydrogenase YagT iron-sulfur-binding subunit
VIFVPEDDTAAHPLGIKGLAEIGVVGPAPAIANAFYDATGRRLRSPAHSARGAPRCARGPRLETARMKTFRQKTSLSINGAVHEIALDPRTTLLDLLREELHLTGTKKGCDHGQCGACTVLVDGRRVLSCLTLAATVRGPVTTVEGIGGEAARCTRCRQAFLEHDAFQCGFCTPGQIMSAIACVAEGRAGSADEVRAAMSGNLCRCSAYGNIVRAVLDGRARMEAPE